MMKKNVFLAVALLALIAVGAFAQQYDSESDFQVSKVGNGMRITKYVGTKTVVNIPPSIQNTPVTQIGENAFANTKITSVTIPDGVTFIWDKAFFPCTELVSVTLNCKVLQGNFKIDAFPEYSLRIMFYQKNAYDGTQGTYTRPNRTSPSWTLTPVTAPVTTQAVEQYTSENDFTVTKTATAVTITKYTGRSEVVNIPPTIQNLPVTIIDIEAFTLVRITSVTIPNSVTEIKDSAFIIGGLTSVTFRGTIPSTKFDAYAFNGDLRAKFYATNAANGTPGTYTRSGNTWTKK
jgi:hypothetical protein